MLAPGSAEVISLVAGVIAAPIPAPSSRSPPEEQPVRARRTQLSENAEADGDHHRWNHTTRAPNFAVSFRLSRAAGIIVIARGSM